MYDFASHMSVRKVPKKEKNESSFITQPERKLLIEYM